MLHRVPSARARLGLKHPVLPGATLRDIEICVGQNLRGTRTLPRYIMQLRCSSGGVSCCSSLFLHSCLNSLSGSYGDVGKEAARSVYAGIAGTMLSGRISTKFIEDCPKLQDWFRFDDETLQHANPTTGGMGGLHSLTESLIEGVFHSEHVARDFMKALSHGVDHHQLQMQALCVSLLLKTYLDDMLCFR